MRSPKPPRRPLFALLFLAGLAAPPGCDDDDEVIIIGDTSTVVSDFQSLADYLDNLTVQAILEFMPRHDGTAPPDVSGQYEASGEYIANSIPGTVVGDPFGDFFFCLGMPSGANIDARVLDTSITTGEARSFIEGQGDDFTVYTAFRSTQLEANGTCEIHEVVVISGRRQADGSLSSLFIGQGVVGLVGGCSNLLVGDLQVAQGTGARTAAACPEVPGGGDGVELVVENFLVNPILVTLSYDGVTGPLPFLVPPRSLEASRVQLVPPGFVLEFESLQPASAGERGEAVLLGEIVAGSFDRDVTPAGQRVTFLIENQVGDDIYFAPSPVVRTPDPVYTIVNSDITYPGLMPFPLGTGIGCICPLEPDDQVVYDLGYYSYSVPGFIQPNQTSARFFSFVDDSEVVPPFRGPFQLEAGSGVVELDVTAGGVN